MSGTLILTSVGLVYLVWGAIIAVKWKATHTLQKELYPLYIKDGTLKPTVTQDAFKKMFMGVEGPRFGIYLYVAACIVPFIIVAALRIFNIIWEIVWELTGELPWFQVDELPHSLMVIFLYVGILFMVAWVTMRRYHLRSPGSYKSAMRRLNGEP